MTGGNVRSVRHGVGIDRDTGRARDKFKYAFEVVEAQPGGTLFELEMLGENLWDTDFALLGIAWKQMERGGAMGARSGSGLGRLTPILTEVGYFDSATLKEYLTSDSAGYPKTKTGQQMIAEWNGKMRRYLEGTAHLA